jgi:hypothetical protein
LKDNQILLLKINTRKHFSIETVKEFWEFRFIDAKTKRRHGKISVNSILFYVINVKITKEKGDEKCTNYLI